MKRIKIIIKSSSFTRLGIAVQQNNFQGWGALDWLVEEPQRKTSGKYWLRRELETAWGSAPVEGWLEAAPWLKGKVRLARGGWRRSLGKIKEPSCFPNAVPAGWGQSRLRAEGGCEGEAHCSVTPAPEGVCAHTHEHTHTHSPGRALRRARQPGSAAQSKHAPPCLWLLARGRRPPLSTP